MKTAFPLFLALAATSALATHGTSGGAGLRQVLQQHEVAPAPAPPRQLTPEERAELRRQLAEQGARRPQK